MLLVTFYLPLLSLFAWSIYKLVFVYGYKKNYWTFSKILGLLGILMTLNYSIQLDETAPLLVFSIDFEIIFEFDEVIYYPFIAAFGYTLVMFPGDPNYVYKPKLFGTEKLTSGQLSLIGWLLVIGGTIASYVVIDALLYLYG